MKFNKEKNQNIQVALRCRPLNDLERKKGSYSVLDLCPEKREVNVKERTLPGAPTKKFTFDRVFGTQSKQVEIYKHIVTPALDEVLQGYNCTIFAYGQTGSGKTFTMEGEGSNDPNHTWESDPKAGIIPRAMHQLFTKLQLLGSEYSVRVSYLEIYNEELTDFLGAESVENPRLRIYEDTARKGSCVIQGLEEVVVRDREEVYSILKKGGERRQTAATNLNLKSSRSHSVFMVTIHIKENTIDGEELLKTGKLNLVDLAGSECIGRSGAIDKRAREAGNINQSLLTLGRVITALVEHAPHVPYRESKLTRLLQDSLGGRTKTWIIATVSPASCNLEETLSTLDYAHRAKNITNRPEINQKLTKKTLIKEYNEEIERLRRDLQASRDKNGIFLAEENYNSMQTQILQQGDSIKELEDRIHALNLEIYKVNELFSECRTDLEETRELFSECRTDLEETKQTLHKTSVCLRGTTQELHEQRHLVDIHVDNEAILHSQATDLMSTVEQSVSDSNGLHSKLDRKSAVEAQNEAAKEAFRNDYNQQTAEIVKSITSFTEEQNLNRSTLSAHLKKSVTDLKTNMAAPIQMVNALKTDHHQQLDRIDQFHSQAYDQNCVSINSLRKIVLSDPSDHQQSESVSTDCQTESTVRELQQKLRETQEKLRQLETEQLKMNEKNTQETDVNLQNLQQSSSCFLKTQQQSFSTDQQRAKELMGVILERSNSFFKSKLDFLKSELNKMSSEFLEKVNEDLLEYFTTSNNYEKYTNNNRDFQETFESDVQRIRNSASANETKSSDQISQHFSQLDNQIQQVRTAQTNVITTLLEKQETDGATNLGRHKDLSQKIRETVESRCNKSSVMVSENVSEFDRQMLVGCDQIEEQTKMEVPHSQDLSERLLQLENFMHTFIDDQLLTDKPTGQTPQRRDYNFPRKLKKTQQHSVLLENFRKDYIFNQAVNSRIPDSSFDETQMSSVSEVDNARLTSDTRLTSESNGVSCHGDDSLSSDSAFSTNSMASSVPSIIH